MAEQEPARQVILPDGLVLSSEYEIERFLGRAMGRVPARDELRARLAGVEPKTDGLQEIKVPLLGKLRLGGKDIPIIQVPEFHFDLRMKDDTGMPAEYWFSLNVGQDKPMLVQTWVTRSGGVYDWEEHLNLIDAKLGQSDWSDEERLKLASKRSELMEQLKKMVIGQIAAMR